jgi:O-6-methylguanine DNA methyltransferase
MKSVAWQTFSTPWGEFKGAAEKGALCRIGFSGESEEEFIHSLRRMSPQAEITREYLPVLEELERQLGEYFSRLRRQFELPLLFCGTPFQKMVWQELLKIPYGETLSYLALAQLLDNPRLVRAVGAANGANPLPFVVPCHRVIGAGGRLVGYGGGLEMKVRLLRLESNQPELIF